MAVKIGFDLLYPYNPTMERLILALCLALPEHFRSDHLMHDSQQRIRMIMHYNDTPSTGSKDIIAWYERAKAHL